METEEDELDMFMSTLEVPQDFRNAQHSHTEHAAAGGVPSTITLEEILLEQKQQEEQISQSNAAPQDAKEDEFIAALLSPNNPAEEKETNAAINDDVDNKEEEEVVDQEDGMVKKSVMEILVEKAKKKEVKRVVHADMNYAPFRKDFYIESLDISSKTPSQVNQEKEFLEIVVKGKAPIPRPVSKWEECGLSLRMLEVLEANKWDEPFAIQRQALPAIMSGRDVIGIANTGSGKTLAFLLPLLRHVKDQAPVTQGQGPIALIVVPARELAQQIAKEVNKFKKALNIDCACLYGGQNVGDQIKDLKKGNEVVVGTPGRLIDILTTQAGKLLPLDRVTFVVLDEADRLLDMGFTPQVERILCNVRPDRQMVMFSATFPPHVEKLAKEQLQPNSLIIVVGNARAGAKCSPLITQQVERWDNEHVKFLRLLQLLGEWYPLGGNILVFVDSQLHVDSVYTELERAGYPSLTLHAGKDQMDRDYAIKDFKSKARTVMVATGVAGRGLDVPDLNLVINYSCPNHVEEYVHRIGRTGRAGKRGTAITFVSRPEDDKYAGDLIFALQASDQEVPSFLVEMKTEFEERVLAGAEKKHHSGYKTKVDQDDSEAGYQAHVKKMKHAYYEKEIKGEKHTDHPNAEEEEEEDDSSPLPILPPTTTTPIVLDAKAQKIAEDIAKAKALAGVGTVAAYAASLSTKEKPVPSSSSSSQHHHTVVEVDINDLPASVRMKVMSKRYMNVIENDFKVSLTMKGNYFPPGKPLLLPTDRKLHTVVESQDANQVKLAVAEFYRLLNTEVSRLSADQAFEHLTGSSALGKYKV